MARFNEKQTFRSASHKNIYQAVAVEKMIAIEKINCLKKEKFSMRPQIEKPTRKVLPHVSALFNDSSKFFFGIFEQTFGEGGVGDLF